MSKDRHFYGTCPTEGNDFQLSRAILFHIADPFPEEAIKKMEEMRQSIRERREAIKRQRMLAHRKAAITTESVNLGMWVEKIVPSFSSFMFSPRDCRALFEPIDYLIFPGLAKRKRVESVLFAEVKSGKARLQSKQPEIQRVVNAGKVLFKSIKSRRG
jgi:predicted Holliday junction resolvase-like endonuclease